MATPTHPLHDNAAAASPVVDASFLEGGAFFRLMRLANLAGDAPRQVRRRVAVIVLAAWFPLALLSLLDGQFVGGGTVVPFLFDVEAHVRFLVALPLLLIAEVEVHRRLPPLLDRFTARRLLPDTALPCFRAALTSATRWRNAVPAEVVLLALVYGVGILIVWRQYWALDTATWYALPSAQGSTLTPAGYWYVLVSVPIVQFLLFRWYWRLFVWARLLWQVSRIELNLLPSHPDRAGGIGFLSRVGHAFSMLALAHGALTAGQIASRIFFADARLPQFADALAIVVLFVLCLIFGPLLFFAEQLAAAKRKGLALYGNLAERYSRSFDDKWLAVGEPTDEPLLGSPDIQSLADLANSYAVVQSMRLIPVSREAALHLAVATLVPAVPLLLTMVPLSELLKMLLGLGH
jgi:hypothetical protein